MVNASALRESAAAKAQGDFITILTRMTVIYLPLTLATVGIPRTTRNFMTDEALGYLQHVNAVHQQ
jgi:hypothetical protein